MPQDPQDLLHPVAWTVLQTLGAISVGSFVSTWTALLALPPELGVETVVDPSKDLSSESRLRVKNLGKLPAYNIRPLAEDINCEFGKIRVSNCQFHTGPRLIKSLANGESAEMPVLTGIHIAGGAPLTSCTYTLRIQYSARLMFLSRTFTKTWSVELRKRRDGYSWIVLTA